MKITQEIAERASRIVHAGGDNFYAKKLKGDKWLLSFTNDYELQHGGGSEIVLTEKIIELIVFPSKFRFDEAIKLRIAESKERGDGEVSNSAYWYQCGLHDSMQIFTDSIISD